MAYKAIKSKEKYVHQYPKTVVRQRLAKGTKLFLILHRTSVTVQWSKCVTTSTLQWLVHPANLSNWAILFSRFLIKEVTRDLTVTLTELQKSFVRIEPFERTTVWTAWHQSPLLSPRVAGIMPLCSEGSVGVCLTPFKRFYDLQAENWAHLEVLQKPPLVDTRHCCCLSHGGGSIMLLGEILCIRKNKFIRMSACILRLKWRFSF